MSGSEPLTQVSRLPFGYTATFIWSPGTMRTEWEPEFPRIRCARARRKFRAAYDEARRQFVTDLARVLGGNILIADTDGPMEVVRPGVKH